MKFFAIAALAAVAAAQYGTPAEETCSVVTVTVTQTMKHTPSAPAAHVPTGPAPYPSKSVQTPLGGTSYPTASMPKPSGTGAYSAPPSQFTGAASSFKAGGVVAAGAIAALFL